jgi:cyclase
MLKHRVIPIMLIDGFSVLKTIQFDTRRNLGSPITVVRTYNTRNVDEMIILDIDASKKDREIDLFSINDITQDCFMPLTIGGGINSLDAIEKTLRAGADKISINNAALKDPHFIKAASRNFGSQCIVVSIDYLKKNETFYVYSHKDKQETDIKLETWCKEMANRGAGELLLTSVDQEGTMEGPELGAIELAAKSCQLPIISAGGVRSGKDCTELILCGASAVAASSIFHFTSVTPQNCKEEMRANNLPVRV